ncbi:MAG: serine/threonine protein kinase [Planctomycetes bacterium]|nr:serine/threonine protein kinase [Planctomycetota bacterium]
MREGSVIADRYRLERLLDRQGTHRIFEGTDLEYDAPVAIRLSTPSTGYFELLARVNRSVQIGRELDRASPGIVRALEGGEVEDSLFTVMDFVPRGEPIELSRGAVDDRLARFRRAALLVRELHALRIVHRDVRPAQFMVGEKGRVFLTGFGSAKSLDDRLDDEDVGRSALALGLPYSYLAPEVLTNAPVDTAMDVYSLGVMLFELLTGELPYKGPPDDVIASQKEVLDGYQEPPVPSQIRPSVPPGLDEVCQWSTHVDPLQRFATVDEFLTSLDEVSGTDRVQRAKSSGPRQPPLRRAPPPPVKARISERMQRIPPGQAPAPRPAPGERSQPRPEIATSPPPPTAPPREVDPLTKTLVILRRTLPTIAGAVSLQVKRREVKFVYFSAHKEISGTVALSMRVPEETTTYAYLEQRVTLDLDAIEAEPSPLAALLLAANAVNLYAPGLRCSFDDERLRFRREVLLGPEAPLEPDDLQRQVDLLLTVWPMVFAALREVQEGEAWNESLGFLVRPRVPDEERQEALGHMLTTEGYVLEERGDGRLLVGTGAEQVELIATPEQVLATVLLRPWSSPPTETKALKKRKPAPLIEALLADLNTKNQASFYTLAWDPKRGVVARAALSEPAFVAARLDLFLTQLRGACQLTFPTLPDPKDEGPSKKKSWLPWRR